MVLQDDGRTVWVAERLLKEKSDIDVLAAFAPDIVWNEAEHNLPLADGNPYIGPQAVLEGVFMRLGEDFDGFGVVPERYIAEGDSVVSTLRPAPRSASAG